jgi:pimeloyl-ACP methyl ester carboxylesterase
MKRFACSLLVVAAVGCGGGPKPEDAAPTAPAAPPPVVVDRTLRAIDVNGTRLAYRLLSSNGTPVVFIHGSMGDLGSWGAQETAFARSYRVLLYSRRYHRPNPPVEDNQIYSPALHAEDLAALLLTLDLAPAHVVGSSYGAYTALELVRRHPQLVRSLVLAEPPVLPLLSGSEAGDAARRAYLTNTLDLARRAFANGDSVGAMRAFYDAEIGGRGSFDNLSAQSRAHVLAHTFEMRREMLANRDQYFPLMSCAELGRITTPVLLLKANRSPPLFQLISDELARCLSNDTTAVVPNAGHLIHAGNPAYYNQVVLRYLNSH